jgi:hypothetical protein
MSFGLIFCILVDLIIFCIMIFCLEFLKLKSVIFFLKKIAYMELELHLKFSLCFALRLAQ